MWASAVCLRIHASPATAWCDYTNFRTCVLTARRRKPTLPDMNLLNLANWTIASVEEHERAYTIKARYDTTRTSCPACCRFGLLQRFGRKEQLYLDLPMHGKRVGVRVERQRYRCGGCGVTHLQPLPDMDDKRQMTRRLVTYIEREALRRTFVSVASETGVDEKTVRNVFHDHIAQLEATHAFTTPRWLGIDELTLIRRPRCIMTNLQAATIVNLLANRSQATVTRALTAMPTREAVEVVCMDMWAPYREASHMALPQARVVVDKFHVVRMANQAVDAVRKSLREGLSDSRRRALMHDRFVLLKRGRDLTERDRLILDLWTQHQPLLAEAYTLKEAFYSVYECPSAPEAVAAYEVWEASIPDRLTSAFRSLTTAMRNWHEEVFAYFEVEGMDATNATTEALNGLAKLANRNGRGYSFEAIRAKMLYGIGQPREEARTYRASRRASRFMTQLAPCQRESRAPRMLMASYGAALSTVIDELRRELASANSTQ